MLQRTIWHNEAEWDTITIVKEFDYGSHLIDHSSNVDSAIEGSLSSEMESKSVLHTIYFRKTLRVR